RKSEVQESVRGLAILNYSGNRIQIGGQLVDAVHSSVAFLHVSAVMNHHAQGARLSDLLQVADVGMNSLVIRVDVGTAEIAEGTPPHIGVEGGRDMLPPSSGNHPHPRPKF